MSNDSSFVDFGFGQNDEQFLRSDKPFKGKTGEKYRASLVWWEGYENEDFGLANLDAPTPKFTGCKRLYGGTGVGYVLYKGPEYVKVFKQAGKDAQPKDCIATILVIWPTDKKGQIDKAKVFTDFEVKSWTISKDKYEALADIHIEFPFGKYDLKMSCSDSQYQKMTFGSCQESLFRKLVEAGKAGPIMEQVRMIAEGLQRSLATDMNLDTLREKLGLEVSGVAPSENVMEGADIDDLLDKV